MKAPAAAHTLPPSGGSPLTGYAAVMESEGQKDPATEALMEGFTRVTICAVMLREIDVRDWPDPEEGRRLRQHAWDMLMTALDDFELSFPTEHIRLQGDVEYILDKLQRGASGGDTDDE